MHHALLWVPALAAADLLQFYECARYLCDLKSDGITQSGDALSSCPASTN